MKPERKAIYEINSKSFRSKTPSRQSLCSNTVLFASLPFCQIQDAKFTGASVFGPLWLVQFWAQAYLFP